MRQIWSRRILHPATVWVAAFLSCRVSVDGFAQSGARIPYDARAGRFLVPPRRRSSIDTRCWASPLPQPGLFSPAVYDTIQSGNIAVIPDFLKPSEVAVLQREAQTLYEGSHFTTDALATYGSSGSFDPSKDRAVLKLSQWKDRSIGDWNVRHGLSLRMASVRADLSQHLSRPGLQQGTAASDQYGGLGSTEISLTRFGPGAYLQRHVDEHHEELKGVAGWSKPTRRSLSWLIYLNPDWNVDRNGGCLRCFERAAATSASRSPSNAVGSRPNGDLQIGWLHPTVSDPVERPVFLDAQHRDTSATTNDCAMYIDDPASQSPSNRLYITKSFPSHPTLFVTGGEHLVHTVLRNPRPLAPEYAERFYFIEPPKSVLTEWLSRQRSSDVWERPLEVPPLAGTLVVFDSVSLPHEVLPTVGRERWAASGWMHEDQQPIDTHPRYDNTS